MLEPELLASLKESLLGPIEGCYVAAYAVSAPGGYLAYAKICSRPPRDIWSCNAIDKVASQLKSTPDLAIEQVEQRAVRTIKHRVQHMFF